MTETPAQHRARIAAIDAAYISAGSAAARRAAIQFPEWWAERDRSQPDIPAADWLTDALADLEAEQQHANEPWVTGTTPAGRWYQCQLDAARAYLVAAIPTAGVMPRHAIYHTRRIGWEALR